MLQGSCLGEALLLWHHKLDSATANDDSDDEYSGPDGNGEGGSDLDIYHNDNNDNSNDDNNNGNNDSDGNDDDDDGSPGPVDGPPILSEVVLAQKRGIELLSMGHTEDANQYFHPAPKYPRTSFQALGEYIGQVNPDALVRTFLFYQQHPTFDGTPSLSLCPSTENVKRISVFHSATAVFCAPSNPSGIGGLYRETIRCAPWWQTGDIIARRRDCVILNTGSDTLGVGTVGPYYWHGYRYKLVPECTRHECVSGPVRRTG